MAAAAMDEVVAPLEDDDSASSIGSSDEGTARSPSSGLVEITRHRKTLLFAVLCWAVGTVAVIISDGRSSFRHWLDSFYLITQIVTTIGYGDDIAKRSDNWRLFVSIYILLMLVPVSYALNAVITNLIEKNREFTWQNVGRLKARAASLQEQLNYRGLESLGPQRTVMSILKAMRTDYSDNTKIKGQLRHATGLFVFYIAFGTCFFHWWEPCSCFNGFTRIAGCTHENVCEVGQTKTPIGSFYMSVVTLTTVGFGDKVPETTVGRLVSIPWMLLGVSSTAYFIAVVQQRFFVKRGVGAADRVQGISQSDVAAIGKDRSGKLSKYEFVTYMLLQEGVVDEAMVNSFESMFNALDATKSDAVSWEEVAAFIVDDARKHT